MQSISRTCLSNSLVVGSLPNCSPASYSPKYSRSLMTHWPIMAAGTHVPCHQIEMISYLSIVTMVLNNSCTGYNNYSSCSRSSSRCSRHCRWSSPCIDGVDAVDPVDATPACLTLHKHFEMHRTREMTGRWKHSHLP